ncbi:hypothetical protein SAMD00023353_6800200 [Rosellinia necatrix]|uniref:DUF7580 domain-containing protein n=1 Tax=Rosellinia necatrix TaxID=77044 RepID=A0A1W2TWQ9_ROSNE|nr:hypothetical protein SAMD00023353_6800200 [Rosellinia necatrix]
MSGFEVAGLVLGAVPLLISALEHYGDGWSTLKRWRKYEHELRSVERNLHTERVKLQNVCEKLLVGIVPESQIEAMIKDPLGSLWRDERTHRKIQSRLWEGYGLFEDTIADIKKAVDEMKERIENQSGKKASTLKRTMFTLSRNQYADLILVIREGVANLENLTDRNIELEPARKVRSQGKLFKVLRTMSKSLYHALKSSLNCPCSHDVCLKLERRLTTTMPIDDSSAIMSDLSFKITLSRLSAWATEGLEEKEWEEILVKPKLSPPDNTHLLETKSLQIQSKRKSKKSVSFASSSNTSTITTTRTQFVPQGGDVRTPIGTLSIDVTSIGLNNLDAITNLCERLKRTQKQAQVSTYGMVVDRSPEGAGKFTLHPMSPSSTGDTRSWSVISLKQILEQKDNSIYLTYQDRLHLAVIISSSILQLHGSPWLSGTISSQDVFFIQKNDFPFYDQPFVMKRPPAESLAIQNAGQDAPFPRNPVLVALGVLLIELIQGKPINLLRTPQEESLAHSKLLQDYMTIKRLLQDVRMASSNYAAAVTRCVDGDFHCGGLTLDNEELCEGVYSGIVALLERDLEYT